MFEKMNIFESLHEMIYKTKTHILSKIDGKI